VTKQYNYYFSYDTYWVSWEKHEKTMQGNLENGTQIVLQACPFFQKCPKNTLELS
jgi:hypothetical protein